VGGAALAPITEERVGYFGGFSEPITNDRNSKRNQANQIYCILGASSTPWPDFYRLFIIANFPLIIESSQLNNDLF
jgi:hypothetical protein